MHQLHFTISMREDRDTNEEIMNSIARGIEEYFTETSYWDWFDVIGFVDTETNILHLKDEDYRFSHIISHKDVDWDEYLGGLLKEKILSNANIRAPSYQGSSYYYYQLKEYASYLLNLKQFDPEIVSGDISNIKIDNKRLPNKLTDYVDFYGYRFNEFGVTDLGFEPSEPGIFGLIDVHC